MDCSLSSCRFSLFAVTVLVSFRPLSLIVPLVSFASFLNVTSPCKSKDTYEIIPGFVGLRVAKFLGFYVMWTAVCLFVGFRFSLWLCEFWLFLWYLLSLF